MDNASSANFKSFYDQVLVDIADYVIDYRIVSEVAYETAYYCLLDSLGCAALALQYPDCTKLLGPIVPDTIVPNGVKIPGTTFKLDPVHAAFNIGILIRWLDFNDTWLAAEWGHPSDNLGGILAIADYLCRRGKIFTIKDILIAMIKAYEIQGILALENSFNQVGLDHVVLVKVATTAIVTHMLGGTKNDILAALSQAWVDGHSLRTYRHAPNTGSRKSWAAGDATSRGVRLAMFTMLGEAGYPSALSVKTWGFYDVLFGGKPFQLSRPYACYVMENILFKVAFPAEFHAQTAVEAAITLHTFVKSKINEIKEIILTTHASAIRIISKVGPLYNYADRDHCLQYMVAIGLLLGELRAEHYGDDVASDPRIDWLREKIIVKENPQYSADYLDPEKRSITNALQIVFHDGTKTDNIIIEYPLGHKRRRAEGIPLLIEKFKYNISTTYTAEKTNQIITHCLQRSKFEKILVSDLIDLFAETT